MAKNIYGFTALTGGGAGALDAIDGTGLADQDMAIGTVLVGTLATTYLYALDADSGAAESSPAVIAPDANASTKRWVLSAQVPVDEDNMASDSATKVPTQQSVKAYVDAHAAVTAAHGATGAAVGTTNTQTLTNKTLTSPKINEDVAVAATATEIDAACNGIGVTIPKVKIVNIGDWNMDSTTTVNVAHGLTLANIRGAQGIIRDDNGNYFYGVSCIKGSILDYQPDPKITYFDATNAVLVREPDGQFDNAYFDSTGYNRGWIMIWYVD